MKITKKELKKIVKEELLKEFTYSDSSIAKKAAEFGAMLGGFPHLAKPIAKVLSENGFTKSAEALEQAYEQAQAAADEEYRLHYPE